MRENHNTQYSEYIIICQDGLYIISSTPEDILYMLKDKYKINIYLQDKYPHDPGGKDNYPIKEYLEHLYENMNILFNNKFSTELHTEFHIIKLLIEKGNLNLIGVHSKNTYQHFNSRIKYIMKCNSWTVSKIFHIYIIYIKFHFIYKKLPRST